MTRKHNLPVNEITNYVIFVINCSTWYFYFVVCFTALVVMWLEFSTS